MLFIVVVFFFVSLSQTFTQRHVAQSDTIRTHADQVKMQLQGQINIITAAGTFLSVINLGGFKEEPSCVDVYLDDVLMNSPDNTYELLNTSFDPELWNPDETLKNQLWHTNRTRGAHTQSGLVQWGCRLQDILCTKAL